MSIKSEKPDFLGEALGQAFMVTRRFEKFDLFVPDLFVRGTLVEIVYLANEALKKHAMQGATVQLAESAWLKQLVAISPNKSLKGGRYRVDGPLFMKPNSTEFFDIKFETASAISTIFSVRVDSEVDEEKRFFHGSLTMARKSKEHNSLCYDFARTNQFSATANAIAIFLHSKETNLSKVDPARPKNRYQEAILTDFLKRYS